MQLFKMFKIMFFKFILEFSKKKLGELKLVKKITEKIEIFFISDNKTELYNRYIK